MVNNQLIAVLKSSIGGESVKAVDARELHDFLEVRTNFNDWINRRIKEYGFVIDSDFCSFLGESSGGRPGQEYSITIDMAKELSMVERNEKGKQARQYFIQCERKSKQIAGTKDTPEITMAKALIIADAKIKQLENTVAEAVPAVDFRNYATNNGTQWTITDAKNELEIELSELQSALRMVGFFRLRKMVRNNRWWPKDKYIDCGYTVEMQDGPNYAFTCKGMNFLRTLICDGIVKAEAMFENDRHPDLFDDDQEV